MKNATNMVRRDRKSYSFVMTVSDVIWVCLSGIFILTIFFLFGVLVGRGYLPVAPNVQAVAQNEMQQQTQSLPQARSEVLKPEELSYQDTIDKSVNPSASPVAEEKTKEQGQADKKEQKAANIEQSSVQTTANAQTEKNTPENNTPENNTPEKNTPENNTPENNTIEKAQEKRPESPQKMSTQTAEQEIQTAEPAGQVAAQNALQTPKSGEKVYHYTYQAAAFKNERAAIMLTERFKEQGLDARVRAIGKENSKWYRVRVFCTCTPSQTRPVREAIQNITKEKPVMMDKKLAL